MDDTEYVILKKSDWEEIDAELLHHGWPRIGDPNRELGLPIEMPMGLVLTKIIPVIEKEADGSSTT